MLVSLVIASFMSVAPGNCCTVSVDFAKSEGLIRPLNGVNNAPCHVGTNANDRVIAFERAGIPFMRTHDTVGMWGGAHYVDIPNIFPDFDADENDPKSYDFTFTDHYLANVVKAGTEVFYRLGVTIENYWRVKRYTTNPPKDFAKWAHICEHVVRHYNEGWADGYRWNVRYWEIWNEPDNPSMWSGTCDEFLDLYVTAAKHLKGCFPDLKVGGFGSCGFYGLNHTERSGAAGAEWGFFDDFIKWYDALLARCRRDSAPLDFFSFHLYTEDPREHVLHTAYARRRLDDCGFTATELINDEWNAMSLADDWSDKSKAEAYGKESHEAAAYVAAVLSVMQRETTLDKAMFYDACPGRSYGTLFHANGKTAPAYEAFLAFNALKELGTSVGVTSSCSNIYALAAKDVGGRQRVLLANGTDQARAVALRLDPAARYQVSRTDEFHSRLLPTGEAVEDGDTLVIPWKGAVFLDRIVEPPVKVIFDTDMNGDFDDVGALAMLHKYADCGRAEILATFSCLPVGKSVPVIEVLNRYFGRADIPTGAPKLENPGENPFDGYGLFPKYDGWYRHADAKNAPDALAEYRRILAAQPDNSVVICGVGSFANFARLLEADRELVVRKVKRLVVMACKHPEGKECNSAADPAATKFVFENWPTPIEFSDFDFGWGVCSGRTVAESDPAGMNPVRDVFAKGLAPRRECFRWSWDHAEGHPSWDQTAVLLAVEGLDSGLWQTSHGKFEMVGDEGIDRWTDDPKGPHSRIVVGNYSYSDLGEMIDRMIALPPSARTANGVKPSVVYRAVKPAIAPGKVKVCMDWDDSCFTDFRLAELCRKYKAKVTFNITPREHADHCYMQRETTARNGTTYHFKGPDGFDRAQTVSIPYLTNKDFKYCYEGFKIAAHLNFPTGDSAEELDYCRQLMEEFLAVAPNVTGQDGFGVVWSGGRWSPGIVKLAKELGFRYCRGANTYEKPGKWGEWTIQPTTYWSEPPEKFWEWYELAKKRGDVFWFWGHTQDLGYDDAIWARLEGIIKRISEDSDAEWIDVGDLAVRRLNRDARFDNAVLRATTDHADALYKVGEKMVFTLKLEGLAEKADGAYYLDWKQWRDDGTERSGVEAFDPSSPKVFETSIDCPGFVRYSFTLLGTDKRPIYKSKDGTWGPIAIICECGAGAEPEKLDFPPEPKDFDAFWRKQLAELRRVPRNAKVEKIEIENESVDCYRLSIPCAAGRPATGYMTVPKGLKDAKWPLNISFHGYGTFTQTAPKSGPKDKIDISINAHGYDLDREPEYYKEFWNGVKLNERGQYGMDPADNARPETSYFRGMVLRAVRAVEWAKTLKNWDGRNLRVWGGSQGGLQCFWAAAFVDGITELEPIVPWGADIIGKTKGRYSFSGLRLEYAPGLDYYEAVNFAKRIPATCRVNISRAGLGDIHCPPSGQWLLYRAIKAPKSITFLQNSNHGGAPGGEKKNRHTTYSEGVAKDAPKGAESSATSLLGDAWNK